MCNFLRAAAVVPKLSVADTDFNTDEIIRYIKKAEDKRADIIVFPELSVTGYTCGDLFFQTTLLKSVKKNIYRICQNVNYSTTVIGAPLVICGQLYNCAVLISQNKICGIVPKTFIPIYNEFYEKRWFSSSEDLNISYINSSYFGIETNYEIPIGRNIIFNVADEISFGIEVCEDVWSPISPGAFLALGGAELIINISASNETISKRAYRRSLISQQSASLISAYIYASAGASESTTDLIFSGHSMIAENGIVIAENDKLADSDYIIFSDIDIGKIKSDRMKIKTFKDAATLYGRHEPCITVKLPRDEICGDGTLYQINKMPFVPPEQSDRLKRCRDIFELQVAGLKKRLTVTGCRPVIGISGGLDSTLALLVAVGALNQLDKPASDVIGITMPCFGTTDRTYNNALKLMETLGVTVREINIKEACIKHFEDIRHDKNVLDVTYENCQARERTQVLMDYAGEQGGLVVGTGDLSELALGWCTYNADHMSMYGVNAGVPKTLVRWMIDSIIDYNIFPESTDVLKDIIDTPISPELLPPDKSGKIVQKTEDIIGPYTLHDFFLYNIIRFGFEPAKVYHLAKLAFKDEYDNETLLKWLKNFCKRFFTQQFKRSCLPDGVKIGSLCLSPRGDWRMPSDASCAVWLKEAENLR